MLQQFSFAAQQYIYANPLEELLDQETFETLYDYKSGILLTVQAVFQADLAKYDKALCSIEFVYSIVLENGEKRSISDSIEDIARYLKFEKNIQEYDSLLARAYIYYKFQSVEISAVSKFPIKALFVGNKYGWLFCIRNIGYSKEELPKYFIILLNDFGNQKYGAPINVFGNQENWDQIFSKYPDYESNVTWYLQSHRIEDFIYYACCGPFNIVKRIIVKEMANNKNIASLLKSALVTKIEYITSQIENPYWYNRESLKKLKKATVDYCIGISIGMLACFCLYKIMPNNSTTKEDLNLLLKAEVISGISMFALIQGYFAHEIFYKDPNYDNQSLPFYKELLDFIIQLEVSQSNLD